MREIKFRAWDNYLKKMVFEGFHIWGEVTEFDLIKMHCYENPNPAYKCSLLRANDMIFMQYTGLKDKNGKEIYEGDLIECHWFDGLENKRTIGKVIFNDNGAFVVDDKKRQDIYFYHHHIVMEVIGNIYENPELLKL